MLCCFVSSHAELLAVRYKVILQVSWGDGSIPAAEVFGAKTLQGAAPLPVQFGMILFHLLRGRGSRVCPLRFSFWSHTPKTHRFFCCHRSPVTCLQIAAVLLSLPHVRHPHFISFWRLFEAEKHKHPVLSHTKWQPAMTRSVRSPGRPQLHVQLQ